MNGRFLKSQQIFRIRFLTRFKKKKIGIVFITLTRIYRYLYTRNITIGLDPAKPLFPHEWKNHRLSDEDAQSVDIVHTTKLILGQNQPMGIVDFYPNNKYTEQPGCGFEYGKCAPTILLLL